MSSAKYDQVREEIKGFTYKQTILTVLLGFPL